MERCLRILPVALTLVALALPVAAADFPAPVLIPTSEQTRGHGTHSLPTVWGSDLAEFLRELGPAMSQ